MGKQQRFFFYTGLRETVGYASWTSVPSFFFYTGLLETVGFASWTSVRLGVHSGLQRACKTLGDKPAGRRVHGGEPHQGSSCHRPGFGLQLHGHGKMPELAKGHWQNAIGV